MASHMPPSHNKPENQAVSASSHTKESNKSDLVIRLNQENEVSSAVSPGATRSPVLKKLHFIIRAIVQVLATLALIIAITICIIVFVSLVMVVVVLTITAFAVIYSSMITFFLGALLVLLIFLLGARILQFFWHGHHYEKLTQFKHFIHIWFFVLPLPILAAMLVLFPFAKFLPQLKQVMLLELSLLKWVEITSIMCGLCWFSSVLNLYARNFLSEMSMHSSSSSLNVGQACSEIVDGLIFWLADHELMKRVPSLKHHELLGLSTQEWIKVSILVLIGYNVIILITHIIVLALRKFCQQQRPKVACNEYDRRSIWQLILKNYLHVKYLMYYANGMAVSISFILSSLLLLLIWILFFGSHLNLDSVSAKNIWEYGKWTFLSLFICSFLWLIKTIVLLVWKAHTVYDRLRLRIISTSEHLYFLGILSSANHDFFRLRRDTTTEDLQKIGHTTFSMSILYAIKLASVKKPTKVRKMLHDDLLIQKLADPTMDDILRATRYFLVAKNDLLEETCVSNILEHFDATCDNREKLKKLILVREVNHGTRKPGGSGGEENVKNNVEAEVKKDEQEQRVAEISSVDEANANTNTSQDEQKGVMQNLVQNPSGVDIVEESSTDNRSESHGKEHVQDDQKQNSCPSVQVWSNDWEIFVEKLKLIKQENDLVKDTQDNSDDPEITFSDIQTWVERAHNQCVNLANTLSSAKEVAVCLNKIISWLLVGAIFIMWLLLTRLATTKVLVLIASPLLAATFIFGDTCKTLFQGIMYVFVVHPFDVGDLCIIEEKMMEVRSIGIWTTTFIKVGKFGTAQELVIYSNLELSHKTIINHKTKFDWSDRVEFNLGPVDKINSDTKHKVINFFMDHLKPHEGGKHMKPEEKNCLKPEIDENCLKKRKCSFLSRIPNLSVSAKEDSITLLVRLEYKAEDTKEWTFSECLRRKDDLKGEFHLYMQEVINKFKAKHGRKEDEGRLGINEVST